MNDNRKTMSVNREFFEAHDNNCEDHVFDGKKCRLEGECSYGSCPHVYLMDAEGRRTC